MITGDYLIIIGSSGSGKTTAVNSIRDRQDVEVPMRYITRPSRLNDDTGENSYVSQDEFEAMVKVGKISIHWRRELDGGRIERYGFARSVRNKKTVLSANNALLRDKNQTIEELLKSSRVVFMYAPEVIRKDRIRRRSPDMKNNEFKKRIEDDGSDVAKLSDYKIDTNENDIQKVSKMLQDILEDM